MSFIRTVIPYEGYLSDFINDLEDGALKQLDKSITRTEFVKVPNSKFLKKLVNEDGIFELRATYKNNQYRVLGFFDGEDYCDTFVVLNGFLKKAKKDYPKQVKKAKKLRAKYYEEKEDNTT